MVEDVDEEALDGSLSPFQTAGGLAGGGGGRSRGDVLTAERNERVDLFLSDEGMKGIGPARQSYHLRERLRYVCDECVCVSDYFTSTINASLTKDQKIHGIKILPMKAGGENGEKFSPDKKFPAIRYY